MGELRSSSTPTIYTTSCKYVMPSQCLDRAMPYYCNGSWISRTAIVKVYLAGTVAHYVIRKIRIIISQKDMWLWWESTHHDAQPITMSTVDTASGNKHKGFPVQSSIVSQTEKRGQKDKHCSPSVLQMEFKWQHECLHRNALTGYCSLLPMYE
jgi:hypothetical protein